MEDMGCGNGSSETAVGDRRCGIAGGGFGDGRTENSADSSLPTTPGPMSIPTCAEDTSCGSSVVKLTFDDTLISTPQPTLVPTSMSSFLPCSRREDSHELPKTLPAERLPSARPSHPEAMALPSNDPPGILPSGLLPSGRRTSPLPRSNGSQ